MVNQRPMDDCPQQSEDEDEEGRVQKASQAFCCQNTKTGRPTIVRRPSVVPRPSIGQRPSNVPRPSVGEQPCIVPGPSGDEPSAFASPHDRGLKRELDDEDKCDNEGRERQKTEN